MSFLWRIVQYLEKTIFSNLWLASLGLLPQMAATLAPLCFRIYRTLGLTAVLIVIVLFSPLLESLAAFSQFAFSVTQWSGPAFRHFLHFSVLVSLPEMACLYTHTHTHTLGEGHRYTWEETLTHTWRPVGVANAFVFPRPANAFFFGPFFGSIQVFRAFWVNFLIPWTGLCYFLLLNLI